MPKTVCLTHEGLSRLCKDFPYDSNFEIKTDNMQITIKCNKIQISFISPIIYKIILNDPTINKFQLKTENSSKCAEFLHSMIKGATVTIPDELVDIFRSIALELGNEEIYSCVSDDLTLDNVLEIVKARKNYSFKTEKEVDYISSHFYEIDQKDISSFDILTLDNILSSKDLVITSEHDLFEFIIRLLSEHEEEDEYRLLLRHLHIEYLSVEDMSLFIKLIDENNIGSFLPCIYRRLLCKLAKFDIPEEEKRRIPKIKVVNEGDKFDGIFSYLFKENDGNPVTKGVVGIEETTNFTQSRVSYLVDPEKRNQTNWYCVTNDIDRGEFIIDFKDKRIQLEGYSLKAHSSSFVNGHFMKSWKIEGSNDKNEWTTVDEQKSDSLRANLAEGFWQCKRSPPFRFFKIRMTERNTSNYYRMGLHAIEFFGFICNDPQIL